MNELKNYTVQIIVIAPATKNDIHSFLEVYGPYPFNLYGNPTLSLYKALGNKEFSHFESLSFVIRGLMKRKFKISDVISKDRRKRKIFTTAIINQDSNIQGSTWLISPVGQVIWRHMDSSPDNHANPDEILLHIQNIK